jgi:hypothetical protein
MNIFKSSRFTWWQLGLLKWSIFLIGIAIGATWPQVFAEYALILFVLGLILSIYPAVVWFRNK